MDYQAINDLNLNQYYGDLRKYIGELPETIIYSIVWKENMKKVNEDFLFRIHIYRSCNDKDIESGIIRFNRITNVFDHEKNKYIDQQRNRN
jgi:hypothetical protein